MSASDHCCHGRRLHQGQSLRRGRDFSPGHLIHTPWRESPLHPAPPGPAAFLPEWRWSGPGSGCPFPGVGGIPGSPSLSRLPSLPVPLGSGSASAFDLLGLSLSPACLPSGTQRGAWTHPSLRGSLSGCGHNCVNRHTIRQPAGGCGTRRTQPGVWRAGAFQQGPQSSRLALLAWEAEAFAAVLILPLSLAS